MSKEGLQLTELRFGALLVVTEGVGETDEGGVGGRKEVTIREGSGLGCNVGQLLRQCICTHGRRGLRLVEQHAAFAREHPGH